MTTKKSAPLLQVLKARFENNMHRHKGIAWEDVHARLEGNADSLRALQHKLDHDAGRCACARRGAVL